MTRLLYFQTPRHAACHGCLTSRHVRTSEEPARARRDRCLRSGLSVYLSRTAGYWQEETVQKDAAVNYSRESIRQSSSASGMRSSLHSGRRGGGMGAGIAVA